MSSYADKPSTERSSPLTAYELSIWNDPSFQKAFTESYIAETDIEPRVTRNERETMQDILEHISSDETDRAITLLKRERGDAASAVFDFTLANIYFQQEQYNQAADVYEVAVDKYPKFRRAWRNLAMIHVRQKNFNEALPALTRVVELGGGDAITYGLLGFAYASVGNELSAESAYRMAILLDSQTLDWKLGLARSLFKQERYAESASFVGRLIDENPNRAEFWLLQANAYIGMNKPLKAAENYEMVDRLGESTNESLNSLGDIYINEQLYDMAVNAYVRAMELREQAIPDRAIRAAKILTARGAYPQAERLVTSLEQNGSDRLNKEKKKDLLKLHARIAVAKGAGDEQVRVLKEIVELDPLDGEALLLLGQHYADIDQTEQAEFYYERAASIEQYEAKAKVRHAQLLVKEGKYKKAVPLLRSAQRIEHRESVQAYLEQVERLARERS